eukprot:Gb_04153 [translate_table: standard]
MVITVKMDIYSFGIIILLEIICSMKNLEFDVSFIDNLPGFPDIRYDRQGTFWIAFPTSRGLLWKLIPKYPSLRRVLVFLLRLMPGSNFGTVKENGILTVDKDGRPIALYSHPKLTHITSGLKIRNSLYFGSLSQNYIGRLDLTQ